MTNLPKDFVGRYRVEQTGCWTWVGATSHNGYGMYGSLRAHRVSLEAAVGAPPEGKPWALHSCDNPPCVNPDHLRWGSPRDNVDDMFLRGRSANGTRATEDACKNGHPWDEYGFFITGAGDKVCKQCRRLHFSDWNKRRKTPGYVPPRKQNITHGTGNAYRWGCRCDPCREAKAVEARREAESLKGVFPFHGTTAIYSRGCRCIECKEAKSRAGKEYYARKKARGG